MDRWPVNRCQVYGRRKEDDFEGKLFKHNIANLFYQAAQVQTAAGFQVREDHNRKPFLRQDNKITGKAGCTPPCHTAPGSAKNCSED
jgi:hypothetical protein